MPDDHAAKNGGGIIPTSLSFLCIFAPLRFKFSFLSPFLLLFLFAGCIPARVPPHLGNTPGPAVIVAGDRYNAGAFEASIPEGWRVITSPADQPPFVIFVAPNGCSLMILAVTPQPIPDAGAACESTGFETTEREIMLDAATITVGGRAPADTWGTFLPVFEQVAASIETSP